MCWVPPNHLSVCDVTLTEPHFPHTASISGSQISVWLSPVLEKTIFKRLRRSLRAARCPRLPIFLQRCSREAFRLEAQHFFSRIFNLICFGKCTKLTGFGLGACFLLNETRGTATNHLISWGDSFSWLCSQLQKGSRAPALQREQGVVE